MVQIEQENQLMSGSFEKRFSQGFESKDKVPRREKNPQGNKAEATSKTLFQH